MKSKFLIQTGIVLFIFLCFKMSFCVHAKNSVFEKEGEVYLIQSAEDMRTLALLVNRNKEVEPGVAAHSASYLLTRDIDLSAYCTGYGWVPIGCGPEEGEDESYLREFNGTFDGGNHVVTGLYINLPGGEYQGLFGYMYGNPDNAEYQDSGRTVIKNLYIKDCDITGGRYVGGVMGGMTIMSGLQNEGDLYIENCHVTGKITGFDSTGGITGAASAVENCSFTGTVKAYSAAGGIAGIAYYICGCAVHAKVEGDLDRPCGGDTGGVGGVAVCVRDSYMAGAVTDAINLEGITAGIGGITGRGSCLTGCYARADVTGDYCTGALLGYPQELDGVPLPEGSSCDMEIQNCLTREEDITDFKEFMERAEEAGQDVWYCVTDYAWPNLSWEKESRFGYTVTVTVQEGDSLGKISDAVLGDSDLWDLIYEENRALIGDDPSLICPGIDLEITVNASLADYAAKGEVWLQAEEFLEKGQEQGLSKAELKSFYRKLLVDDLWNGIVWKTSWADFNRQLNDWIIADLDGNGQKDMIVMAGDGKGAVPGEIRLYFNGEPAYILKDENAYYEDNFVFNSFWEGPFMADLDNDGNLELLFAVGNGGNGGPGGRDNCLLRHEEDCWVECLQELPNDEDRGGLEIGLRISVIHIGVDRYEAYCPYLEERVEFDAKNFREISEDEFGQIAGANIRGFFDFQCVKYEGKNALQCREFLCGEGGNAYGVGEAVFLLVWDTDGACRVADWWVEGYMD